HLDNEVFTADHIITAVDAGAASSLVNNSFGENNLYFPRSLRNAIIRLWFDRAPKSGPEGGMFTGDFVMHNFFWLERIYQPYREWHKATGGSAVEVHIYGPEQKLAEPGALLLTEVISDIYRAYPELRGHLITQHLQYNEAVHTLPSLGSKELHPGVVSRWPNFYFAGDWVRDTLPSFFLERACATGIKAANHVLSAHQMPEWILLDYLPPEPFAGWIQKIMINARDKRRQQKKKKG
ncbi:MAG: FAD-dependent oxidoreductase, partial [Chloroflexota bacterium]